MTVMEFRAWRIVANKKCCKMIYSDDFLTLARFFNKIIRDDEAIYKFMQFTGLKDKNGKKICESDIVNCSYWEWNKETKIRGKFTETGFINWLGFKCGFVVSLGKEKFINLELGAMEFAVIGNIYENPKLFGAKK